MKEIDLIVRTKKFALRVIKLVDALPNTLVGRTIEGQLIRSIMAASKRTAKGKK